MLIRFVGRLSVSKLWVQNAVVWTQKRGMLSVRLQQNSLEDMLVKPLKSFDNILLVGIIFHVM